MRGICVAIKGDKRNGPGTPGSLGKNFNTHGTRVCFSLCGPEGVVYLGRFSIQETSKLLQAPPTDYLKSEQLANCKCTSVHQGLVPLQRIFDTAPCVVRTWE